MNGGKERHKNLGNFYDWTNIDLDKLLCAQMNEKLGRAKGKSEGVITYLKDRPGHDCNKLI